MKWILLVAALIGVISIVFMVGYMTGYRRTLRRPGLIDINVVFKPFYQFIGDFAQSLAVIGWTLNFNRSLHERRPNEHPVDWIDRVGLKGSGYNVQPGEYWRFRELRDWWEPDNVPDQYGVFYKK